LDSHPEFAKPSAVNSNGTVYSTSELRDLVAYANKYNITIMPEINLPGHAGAWHGIPGMLVPCPNFICTKGYGIPLNIHHPKVMEIIKDIIQEVSEIFYTSPFFHLGGDEVHMAAPCFEEAGLDIYD
jgi:hexosaminidase